MKTKRCSKCGIEKALEEFPRHRGHKDGVYSQCKKCKILMDKKDYLKHHKTRLIAQHKYRNEHLEVCRARTNKWHKDHPEGHRAASLKYDRNNREKNRTRHRKRYVEHHEEALAQSRKSYQKCKKRAAAYKAAYCQTQKGKLINRQSTRRRQTLKRALPATLTVKQWQRILLKGGNQCTYCDREFSDKLKAVQDHFIPLSKGGAYTKENIVPACQSCNSRKSNKVFKDIHEAREYLKKE